MALELRQVEIGPRPGRHGAGGAVEHGKAEIDERAHLLAVDDDVRLRQVQSAWGASSGRPGVAERAIAVPVAGSVAVSVPSQRSRRLSWPSIRSAKVGEAVLEVRHEGAGAPNRGRGRASAGSTGPASSTRRSAISAGILPADDPVELGGWPWSRAWEIGSSAAVEARLAGEALGQEVEPLDVELAMERGEEFEGRGGECTSSSAGLPDR